MEVFTTGMRVKLLNDDGAWVHGEVTETGPKGFFVRWDDLDIPCDYSYDTMPPLIKEPAAQTHPEQSAEPS